MGAEDYLLKHELSPDVLLQKLGEIRRRLIRERRLSSQKGKIDLLTRRSLLRELVLHANAPAVADAALLSRNAQSAGAVCTVVCMQLVNFLILYQADRGSPNHEKITGTVMDLCTSIFSNLGSGLIAHIDVYKRQVWRRAGKASISLRPTSSAWARRYAGNPSIPSRSGSRARPF